MLDLHIANGQSILIETPSGGVEVWADAVRSQDKEVELDVIGQEALSSLSRKGTFGLHDEIVVEAPDGNIRIKVLRFRPKFDGTGGSVSLGLDAPREWRITR